MHAIANVSEDVCLIEIKNISKVMVKFLKLLDQQVDLLKVKWVSTLFDSRSFLWQKNHYIQADLLKRYQSVIAEVHNVLYFSCSC